MSAGCQAQPGPLVHRNPWALGDVQSCCAFACCGVVCTLRGVEHTAALHHACVLGWQLAWSRGIVPTKQTLHKLTRVESTSNPWGPSRGEGVGSLSLSMVCASVLCNLCIINTCICKYSCSRTKSSASQPSQPCAVYEVRI